MKILKEIAEELAKDVSTSSFTQRILAKRIMLVALEYAKSIVPKECTSSYGELGLDEKQRGRNFCRGQILDSIQESEELLKQ